MSRNNSHRIPAQDPSQDPGQGSGEDRELDFNVKGWKLLSPEVQRKVLYNSRRWRTLRKAFLKANPICQDCGAPATIADHRLGHGPGWERRFFQKNCLAPRCESCHNRKTQLFDLPARGLVKASGRRVNQGPTAMELALRQMAAGNSESQT